MSSLDFFQLFCIKLTIQYYNTISRALHSFWPRQGRAGYLLSPRVVGPNCPPLGIPDCEPRPDRPGSDAPCPVYRAIARALSSQVGILCLNVRPQHRRDIEMEIPFMSQELRLCDKKPFQSSNFCT